jgi:toxin FitB
MILDTNVLSALMSVPPVAAVIQWMDEQAADRLFTTAITVAEVRYGLGIMPEGRRRTDLILQADAMFGQDFRGRILSFDEQTANAFGELSSQRRALGRPISISDGYIAAIATVHAMPIVNRNVKDFEELGLQLINPFENV